ncbi:MAG: aspartate aminotransferase family protein [Proteobacteria bacterium]|nr:MAG: aspartate aminotransferase family protein [Pseudomonadota bacterium]
MKPLAVYPKLNIRLKSASGVRLTTEDDQSILDFYSGHGVISIGHSHPHFIQRLTEQLHSLAYYSNLVPLKEQDELCLALGEISDCQDYNIFFSNSGAEAIENALKAASMLTGESQVVAMRGSFHGRTSLAAQITDASKLCAPINSGLEVKWLTLDNIEEAKALITRQTAAVIIEGIQGVGGIQEGHTEFWQTLRALCDETGALLIADEIQSGMGRTGKFFAFQHHGIKPDIICTAKGLGNGFPVAATWLRADYELPMGSLGSTFGGGPLACRAALSVCEILAADKLIERSADLGQYLTTELKKIKGLKNIRGRGLMLAFDLNAPSDGFRAELLKQGVITGSASTKETVRLLPPLSVTKADCDEFLTKLKRTVEIAL